MCRDWKLGNYTCALRAQSSVEAQGYVCPNWQGLTQFEPGEKKRVLKVRKCRKERKPVGQLLKVSLKPRLLSGSTALSVKSQSRAPFHSDRYPLGIMFQAKARFNYHKSTLHSLFQRKIWGKGMACCAQIVGACIDSNCCCFCCETFTGREELSSRYKISSKKLEKLKDMLVFSVAYWLFGISSWILSFKLASYVIFRLYLPS